MDNSLPQNVVRIHLDTTQRFSIELAAGMLAGASETIRTAFYREFGAKEEIHISLQESGEGTWWAQIILIVTAPLSAVAVTALAVEALSNDVREGRTPFSRNVAGAMDEGDGRSITLSSQDMEIGIPISEMPSYPPPVGQDRAIWAAGVAKFTDSTEEGLVVEADGSLKRGSDGKLITKPLPNAEDRPIADSVPAPGLKRPGIVVNGHRKLTRYRPIVKFSDPNIVEYGDADLVVPSEFETASLSSLKGRVHVEAGQRFVTQDGKRWRLCGFVSTPDWLSTGEFVELTGYQSSTAQDFYPTQLDVLIGF